MNNHEHYEQLLSVYIDGEVSAQERALIEDHLISCSACQRQYKEMKQVSAKLREWPEEELSPDLQRKIKSALQGAVKEKGMTNKFSRNMFTLSSIFVAVLIVFIIFPMYLKRGIQGRLKAATDDIAQQFSTAPKQMASLKSGAIVSTPAEGLRNRESHGSQANMYDKMASVAVEYRGSIPERSSLASTEKYEPYYLSAGYIVPHEDEIAPPMSMPIIGGEFHTEEYDRIYENKFLEATQNPLSTFSIDVDTASYSNVRRFLTNNQLPAEDVVRIEEMINYFSYDYPQPSANEPFSITTQAAVCPWNTSHQLALVGIQGKKLDAAQLPPSNLVFLIDVSGSMNTEEKLPLLRRGFEMMVNQLGSNEKIAIVVYAGAAGKVLDSTSGADKQTILNAIRNLQAGGSTAGAEGIKLAYEIARQNFIKNGNNRVILATDGDFNVGVSSDAELLRLIESERKAGVFLTVLGFGTGNYKDSKMEQLADKGNGNYYYIDTINEARKVLVQELGSTLFTIAKDVKIQIEFNPSQVKAYRLIGYENRVMAKEDFNDDTKDAGELGAGHTVTALYEIIPADSAEKLSNVDELTYQKSQILPSTDLMTVKLRYKEPDGDTSKLIQKTIPASAVSDEPKDDFAFAAAVAEFGMILRNSEFKGNATYDHVLNVARATTGKDPFAYRSEFISLVEKAKSLDYRPAQGSNGIQFK